MRSSARSNALSSTMKQNLRFVIGKGGRRIPAEQAAEHIAGYMITDDVSARDLGPGESKKLNQPTLFQMTRAKGWDTFQPTGRGFLRRTRSEAMRTFGSRPGSTTNCAKTRSRRRWRRARTSSSSGSAPRLPCGRENIITTGSPAGVAAGMPTPKWLVPVTLSASG